jgi:hypothetical protein
MTRSQIGFLFVGIAMTAWACLLIGKNMGNQSRIVITQMPEQPVCQPFRTPEDQKAQKIELDRIGATPVMVQMLTKAYEEQSKGKIELIPIADMVCKENVGSIRSVRTTTYYAIRKKI